MGEMALFKCFLSCGLLSEIFLEIFISQVISQVFREFLHHEQFKRMQSTVNNTKEYRQHSQELSSRIKRRN